MGRLRKRTVRAYLAVDCPAGGIKRFKECTTCQFQEYNSITECAVTCTYSSKPDEEE